VLPAQRSHICEQVLVDAFAADATKINGVPKDNGGDDQVETMGAILPPLVRAIRSRPNRWMDTARPRWSVKASVDTQVSSIEGACGSRLSVRHSW